MQSHVVKGSSSLYYLVEGHFEQPNWNVRPRPVRTVHLANTHISLLQCSRRELAVSMCRLLWLHIMAPMFDSRTISSTHHHTGRLTFHGCWHRSVVPEYKWCPMWESNALYLGSVSCDICGCPKFPHCAKKKLGSKAPSGDRAFQSEFPMEALYGLWLGMIGRRSIIDAPQFWGLFVMLCRCNWGNTHFTCDWCCQAKSETKRKLLIFCGGRDGRS